MKLASATLWHFFSPWFKSAPSIRWVDRRDAQESFLTLLLITNSQKKRTQREQIFNTSTHLAGSNGMYRRNLNVSYGISPFLLAQRLWSFFWCFKQKKTTTTTKTLQPIFSLKKNLDIFLFHFYSFFVCWRSRAASSSRHHRRLQHGWAKGKQRDGLESDKTFFRARIQTSCLGGTVSAEHLYLTHVPLFVLVPAEGTGQGYFGGLCLFFFSFDTTTSFQHEAK